MMIATGFSAISPLEAPEKKAGDYTGGLSSGKAAKIAQFLPSEGDLRLKNKPIGIHFSGIGAGGGEGDFPSLSFANYMSERSFGFTALQYGVGGSLSCAGLTPSFSRTVAPRFWRRRNAASCARAFMAPPCRRFAPKPA